MLKRRDLIYMSSIKFVAGTSMVWVNLNASHPGVDCYYLGHHKCASNWMRRFLYDICDFIRYDYIVHGGDQSKNISSRWRPHTFFLYVNSTPQIMESIQDQARGFHLIRDPRDVLISDYFSIKITHRVHIPQVMEMRHYLREHSLEEGLLYMLRHCPYFRQIEGWKLRTRPNILDVKYEDLLADEKGVFTEILRHLNVTIPEKKLDDIVQKCSFKSLSGGRERGHEDPNSHFRKGVAGDWKNYMEEDGVVYNAFYERYGHLVRLLGYE